MEQQSEQEEILTTFIYNYPEIVARLLKASGYNISGPLTLQKIIPATFKAIYSDMNQKFINELESAMQDPEYNNIIALAVISIGISIAGMFSASKQAKKSLEVQKSIALAQLAVQKNLAEEQIRTQAETERTKILLGTLQQYRSDLQSQSTKRLRDVGIYVGIMACGISMIYGIMVILKTPKSA